MKRLLPALLLITSCATMSGAVGAPPIEYGPAPWADSVSVKAAIDCATEAEFPLVASKVESLRVLTRPNYLWAGRFDSAGEGTIFLDASARSAGASAWRHETVHAGLYYESQPHDAHQSHDAVFLAREQRFLKRYVECKRRQV